MCTGGSLQPCTLVTRDKGLQPLFKRRRLEHEIRVTDAEIDRLVYQLYDLTEEEIKIVEGSVNK